MNGNVQVLVKATAAVCRAGQLAGAAWEEELPSSTPRSGSRLLFPLPPKNINMGAKSGKKSSLKATLQSQQSRLLKKQKAAQKALAVEQKQKEKIKGSTQTKSKGKEKAGPPQITIPFRPTDRILLIGEGNFSFARALVSELPDLPASNVTATAYDSQEECFAKYADAEEVVEELKGKGVEVLFGVDASKLEKVGALKRRRWDRIVWNFPHAGVCRHFLDVYYEAMLTKGDVHRKGHYGPGQKYPLQPGPNTRVSALGCEAFDARSRAILDTSQKKTQGR